MSLSLPPLPARCRPCFLIDFMPANNTDSLIANSLCIHRCIPDGMKMSVLIYQLATIAGLPTDKAGIQSLIDNSVCIDKCIPDGLKWAVLIGLFAKLAGIDTVPMPTPTTNLIPAGAVYDVAGRYYMRGGDGNNPAASIIQFGGTYLLKWGNTEFSASDMSSNGTYFSPASGRPGAQSSVQFTYNGAGGDLGFYLTSSTPGALVTATIYAV